MPERDIGLTTLDLLKEDHGMPPSSANSDSRVTWLLALAALAAVCAVIVSVVMHSVRGWAPTSASIGSVAVIVWLVLVAVGTGGAWLLSRLLANT